MAAELKIADIRRREHRLKVLPEVKKLCLKHDLDLDEFDVFHALVSGEAGLFINDDGFFILREDEGRFDKAKILFVWMAVAFKQGQNFIKEKFYLDWLEKKAKEMKAEKIQFYSPRKGYERVLAEWKTMTIFEKEVI